MGVAAILRSLLLILRRISVIGENLLYENLVNKGLENLSRKCQNNCHGDGASICAETVVGDGVLDVPHYWLCKPNNGMSRAPSPTTILKPYKQRPGEPLTKLPKQQFALRTGPTLKLGKNLPNTLPGYIVAFAFAFPPWDIAFHGLLKG